MKREAALRLLEKLRSQSPTEFGGTIDKLVQFWSEQGETLDEEQERIFKEHVSRIAQAVENKRPSKPGSVTPKDQSDFNGASKIMGIKPVTGSTQPQTAPKLGTPRTEPPKSIVDVKPLQAQLGQNLKLLAPSLEQVTKAKGVPTSAKASQVAVTNEVSALARLARDGGTETELRDGLERVEKLPGIVTTFQQALLSGRRNYLEKEYAPLRERVETVAAAKPPRGALASQKAVTDDKTTIEQALAGDDSEAILRAIVLVRRLEKKITTFDQTCVLAMRESLNNAMQTLGDELRRVLGTKEPGPEAVKLQLSLKEDIASIRKAGQGVDYDAMLVAAELLRGFRAKIKRFDEIKQLPKPEPTLPQIPSSTPRVEEGEDTVQARNKRISDNVSTFGKLSLQDKQRKLSFACEEINKPNNEKLLANAGVEKYVEWMLAFSSKNPREKHEQKALLKLYGAMTLDRSFMQDDGPRRDTVLNGLLNDEETRAVRDNWSKGGTLTTDTGKQNALRKIQRIQTKALGFTPGAMEFGVNLGESSGQCEGKVVKFSHRSDKNTDFDETLNTLVHETTHAYQSALTDNFNHDLSLKDPSFANDPRYGQALLFALNNRSGMYAKPPLTSDPQGLLSEEQWLKSEDYNLQRRAYENEPVEAHAWRAGNEAGRVFNRSAQTLSVIPALKTLKEAGINDPRLVEIVRGLKSKSISDVTGAIVLASDLARETCERFGGIVKRVYGGLVKAWSELDPKTQRKEYDEMFEPIDAIQQALGKAYDHSNARRWLESTPFYVKAYGAAKPYEGKY